MKTIFTERRRNRHHNCNQPTRCGRRHVIILFVLFIVHRFALDRGQRGTATAIKLVQESLQYCEERKDTTLEEGLEMAYWRRFGSQRGRLQRVRGVSVKFGVDIDFSPPE